MNNLWRQPAGDGSPDPVVESGRSAAAQAIRNKRIARRKSSKPMPLYLRRRKASR